MKKQAILLLFLSGFLFGKEIHLKSIENSDSVNYFIEELKPFLESPLSWCKLEPSGKVELYGISKQRYNFLVEIESTCNDKIAKENLTQIVKKYENIIKNNEELIDNRVSAIYPHLKLIWGRDLFNQYVFRIRYKKLYSKSSPQTGQKIAFFNFYINGYPTYPGISRFDMHGGNLIEVNINEKNIKNATKTTKKWFLYKIDSKILQNNEKINLEIERIYKINKNHIFNNPIPPLR